MSLTSRCMLNNYWEYSIQTKNSIKVPSSKETDRRFITFANQHSTQGVHGNAWSGQIPKSFIQLVFSQTDLALTRKGAQLIVRVRLTYRNNSSNGHIAVAHDHFMARPDFVEIKT